jgi:hypothetical protein
MKPLCFIGVPSFSVYRLQFGAVDRVRFAGTQIDMR